MKLQMGTKKFSAWSTLQNLTKWLNISFFGFFFYILLFFLLEELLGWTNNFLHPLIFLNTVLYLLHSQIILSEIGNSSSNSFPVSFIDFCRKALEKSINISILFYGWNNRIDWVVLRLREGLLWIKNSNIFVIFGLPLTDLYLKEVI